VEGSFFSKQAVAQKSRLYTLAVLTACCCLLRGPSSTPLMPCCTCHHWLGELRGAQTALAACRVTPPRSPPTCKSTRTQSAGDTPSRCCCRWAAPSTYPVLSCVSLTLHSLRVCVCVQAYARIADTLTYMHVFHASACHGYNSCLHSASIPKATCTHRHVCYFCLCTCYPHY
jgi:hypothetical protein